MRDQPVWRRYMRFWGPDPLRDADDEVDFHLAMKREELRSAGVPPDHVEEELARAFGDRARIMSELKSIGTQRSRRYRRAMYFDELATDLRQSWRSFRRRPLVPAIIVGTLALAMGAGTAVFTLFDAVLLNPLAVDRPDELVRIQEESSSAPGFSYPMSRFLREHSTTTDGIAGWATMDVGIGWADVASQVTADFVTGNYFSVLGVQPQHGRLFIESDEGSPGASAYVVLSDALWHRMFGADPSIIGQTVAVNEVPVTVIGVARPGFRGTALGTPVDVWIPVTMVRTIARTGLWANDVVLDTWYFNVFMHVARVPADVSVDGALAELSSLHRAGMENAPRSGSSSGVRIGGGSVGAVIGQPLVQVAAGRSRAELIRFLAALGTVVAITLAIACVNVANLLLMRSRERHLEMTIRAAVGASAARVARQLLLESVLLALLAGVVGTVIGMAAVRLFTSFSLPGGIALSGIDLSLDGRVLSFAAVVTLVCAVLFGLAPVVSAARTNPMNALRAGHDRSRPGRLGARGVLVAAQVALSLVLLVAGSLFAGSLRRALSVDPGFRSNGAATVSVGLRQYGYSEDQAGLFVRDVIDAVRSRPGIEHAAAATRVPIETDAFRFPIYPVDAATLAMNEMPDRAARDTAPRIPLVGVTPGYLEALDIELIDGRNFDWSDRSGSQLVAIVTLNAADRLWPGENPIGERFVPMFGESFAVIGVTRDAHMTNLSDREPHIFVPLAQTLNLAGMDHLRFLAAGTDADESLNTLRRIIRDSDPRLPLYDARKLDRHMDAVLMPQRFGMLLVAVLGGVALMICGIGIHAVAAYDVATRRRELGIRAALGAERRDLVNAVLRRAAIAITAGIVLGLSAAAVTTQGLRSLLFDMTPYEPGAYIVAAVLLGLVAVLASWIPARRAARTDPLTVVRDE